MQVQGNFAEKEANVKLMNASEMTKHILKTDGIKGMFKGITVNFFKVQN